MYNFETFEQRRARTPARRWERGEQRQLLGRDGRGDAVRSEVIGAMNPHRSSLGSKRPREEFASVDHEERTAAGYPRPSWAGMPCRTTRSTRTIRRRDTPPASRQVCASPQPLTNALRARGVLRAASFASLPHFASANNGPPSSCGDVLSCVLGSETYAPSPPSPLAGFHIQRKRSFDNLNMDSAEQDRCAMDASRHPQPPRSLPISRCFVSLAF